ncbi:MAG: hypothetical protein F9K26_12680 [Ignavibacteriaceae bacterium]|nr:MAG: hypothetical protein F9K26_12680 [Ignavibacteriaceae bacterium]
MIEITYSNIVGTASQIIVAGLLASNLLPAKTVDKNCMAYIQPSRTEYTPTYNWYSSSQNLSFNNLEHEIIKHDDFEKSVGRFYARLLANQEPLGAEFEAVLHKNLWDLYES